MIKGAKVLRNAQVVDRFAPHDFLSALRSDQTLKLLDAVIGCMEPERDYILNLHQDEQIDDSHVMITNTVSFEPIVRCRDCLHVSYDGVLSTGWCNENCREVRPDCFCAWGERRKDGITE